LGDFQYKLFPNIGIDSKSLDHSSSERFRTENRFRIDLEHTDQPVSCIPDVSIVERDNEHDEFLVLGCDGVFDVLMNNELAILIKSLFAEKEDLSVTTEGKDIHKSLFQNPDLLSDQKEIQWSMEYYLIIKWGAPFRWSFRPSSASDSLWTTNIHKTQPTLFTYNHYNPNIIDISSALFPLRLLKICQCKKMNISEKVSWIVVSTKVAKIT